MKKRYSRNIGTITTEEQKILMQKSVCVIGCGGLGGGIIENLTRKMEKEIEIVGIYYDQVSATSGRPCYNEKHSHALGGGSYWTDGFNKMMKKINRQKPKDSFYFSECNAEGYMKYM